MKEERDNAMRTEIVADVKRCGRRPGLNVRKKIPAGSATDGDIRAANASEKNRREDDHDENLHRPRRPQFLHFSSQPNRK